MLIFSNFMEAEFFCVLGKFFFCFRIGSVTPQSASNAALEVGDWTPSPINVGAKTRSFETAHLGLAPGSILVVAEKFHQKSRKF